MFLFDLLLLYNNAHLTTLGPGPRVDDQTPLQLALSSHGASTSW